MRVAAGLLFGTSLLGCTPTPTYDWDLPPGIPAPVVPANNPMSAAKVELGRHLFFDERLSGNGTQSCGSCHDQSRAFTDGLAVSLGSTGESTPRNAMALANVAYNASQTWANPALVTLEQQALAPIFGEFPVELGVTNREAEVVARFREDTTLRPMFEEAFPGQADPVSMANIVFAIASYERSLLSFGSPYDRYFYGNDETAMSDSALRGMTFFFSERGECFHCHGGFNFAGSVVHGNAPNVTGEFQNNALYNIDGRGGYPRGNRGLYEHTGNANDMGRFRPPSLRNVALTAPYMHDGSIATLDGVIDHYAAGGRTLTEGPNAGVGSESPVKSIFLHGFTLTTEERADLLAFLEALTDEGFVQGTRHQDPARD
jgi:cytochrome c peroxidase